MDNKRLEYYKITLIPKTDNQIIIEEDQEEPFNTIQKENPED